MLNEREKQICARLRRFRELLQIPRTKFALTIGISGERLASYEAARARVPYGVAREIALAFWMNEAWLAEGTGEPTLILDSGPERPETIPASIPFTEAYDSHLKSLLESHSTFLKSSDRLHGGGGVRSGLGVADRMRESFVRQVASDIQGASVKSLPDYFTGWRALSEGVKQKHRKS